MASRLDNMPHRVRVPKDRPPGPNGSAGGAKCDPQQAQADREADAAPAFEEWRARGIPEGSDREADPDEQAEGAGEHDQGGDPDWRSSHVFIFVLALEAK